MNERNPHPKYGKNRTSHREWRAVRTWARRNMDPICHICKGEIDLTISNYRLPEAWTLDHIIPVAQGGTNDRNNLKPAHRGCNSRKGDGTTQASRTFTRTLQGSTETDRLFPVSSRHSQDWVPPEHRPGPHASDRRAFVYGPTPDFPVVLDYKGEQHLNAWDNEISWKPGQPWPPQLPADPYQSGPALEVPIG